MNNLDQNKVYRFDLYDGGVAFGNIVLKVVDKGKGIFHVRNIQKEISSISSDSIVSISEADNDEYEIFHKKQKYNNEQTSNRLSQEEYFLQIAKAASLRSTCKRARVGCVIIHDSLILSTGYNGSLPGHKHCIDDDCALFEDHCIQTIHAEINAIERAIRAGFYDKLSTSVLYSTHKPCYSCIKTLAAFGITNIVFEKEYIDGAAKEFINIANLNIKQISSNHLLI